jgi:AhpD family alkylhydroperoxidase
MTRLPDPDPATVPVEVRQFLAMLPPYPLFRMATHAVATVQPFLQLGLLQFEVLALSDRFRELATLTVAACTDCEFTAAQHVPMSAQAGITDELRAAIARKDFDHPALDARDQVVIKFAAEVVARPRVDDELFGRARAFLTDREIVELIQVCGFYLAFNRIATTLDVPAGDG